MNEQALKDLGRAHAGQAAEFLKGKLGRDLAPGEVETFVSYSSSWMAARVFGQLFLESPEMAESFLRQTLINLATAVRFQKVNAMVDIQVSIDLIEEETVAKAEEPVPVKKMVNVIGCGCVLKNGTCEPCVAKLAGIYAEVAVFLHKYVKEMSKQTQSLLQDCEICAHRYSDRAVAMVVQEGVKELEGENAGVQNQVFQGIAQFAAALGITEFPVTTKAFEGKFWK